VREPLDRLADVALSVLPSMFDERTGLFSHKTLAIDGGYTNGRANADYSAAALAGILSQRRAEPDRVVPVPRALDALHAVAAVAGSDAMLGNLLWASALADDERAGEVLIAAQALDARAVVTAALGQLLHGVVAAGDRFPRLADRADAVAAPMAAELLDRFVPDSELFRAGRLRLDQPRVAVGLRYTSFAHQVYPLHGLAAWYRRHGRAPDPLLRRVADRLVGAQGPLGQWWWLYAIGARRVIEGYPVYSVHQDGMAFMALAPLKALGIGDYDGPLARGLDWLDGANELHRPLTGDAPPFICRCIQRTGSHADLPFGISKRNLRAVQLRSLRTPARDVTEADAGELEILEECRSYHLGWLLYAHALMTT